MSDTLCKFKKCSNIIIQAYEDVWSEWPAGISRNSVKAVCYFRQEVGSVLLKGWEQ